MKLESTDMQYLSIAYQKILTESTPHPSAANVEPAETIVQQAASKIAALNQSQVQPAQDEVDVDNLFSNNNAELEQYLETDLPVYNYKTLKLYLEFAYDTKDPLLVYGDPGLGKSQIVKAFAAATAKQKNKQFVEWAGENVTDEMKQHIIKNPSDYFVLIDVRTAQLEPSDLVGIPDIASSKAYLETKQPKWIYLMSMPSSDGILFLDELNQGHEQVLKALYEVVLDKSAAGRKFSNDWCIIGAGNLGAEHGNQPLPKALTNRFTAGVLIADPEAWLEWAESAGIDKYIIAFVKSNPSENFYTKPRNEDDPFPTPRQMDKLSKQMRMVYRKYHDAKIAGRPMQVPILRAIGDLAAGKCGVYWARKFVTFIKHVQSFNLRELINTAESLPKEQADKLHALVTFISGKIKTNLKHIPGGVPKDEQTAELVEALCAITIHLKTEWRTILWSTLRSTLHSTEMRDLLMAFQNFAKSADPSLKAKLQTAIKGIVELMKNN